MADAFCPVCDRPVPAPGAPGDVIRCSTCGRKSRWAAVPLPIAMLRKGRPTVMVGAAWFMTGSMVIEWVQLTEPLPVVFWAPLSAAPLAAVIGTLWLGRAVHREAKRELVLLDE